MKTNGGVEMERNFDEVLVNHIYVGSADSAEKALEDKLATHVFDVRVKGRQEAVSYPYTHTPIEEQQIASTIKQGAEQIASRI